MRKNRIAKAIASMIPLLCVTIFNSCDSWMKDDDFFSSVEEEVRVANAEKLNVFVRCAATKMGTTNPNGYAVFKQDVVSSVSMVPETDYGFWKWAAFSTDFFDPNKQHTSLLCQNPESYAESFAPFELDPAVVTFENPNSEITNVTIHANRNDVVLVPVCVERPMLTVSIPGSGEANVVRNMSIRLLFSKPMDPKSFYDEETGASNFTFLQGRATITESSDVSLTDISDYFESPIFSMGGKLITFKLKSDKLFNANGQITVRYTGEVKDIYGYNVASGSSFQFRVGTAVDSSSPGIDVLTFGVEGKYNTFKDIYSKFRSEANVASVKGVSDELCATSLDDPAFDTIATYRTKSNIVDIYVHGIEYKGSSKNKVNASGDESESDIVIIGTRSCLVYNKDGTPTGANIAEEKVAEIDYAAGVSYSKDIPESEFNETTGTLFSYDITDYPDGLIRIDVALADSVGNFGFDDNCTNPENDNGYKSVFIVKDTSAPDAVAIKDAIQSDSESAIYQWYNEKTLGTIRFKDMEKDNPIAGIVDSGHFHLRSAKKDMKWIFHSGAENDEWAPSENDAGWKDVSVSYDLKNAVLPGSDGYVPISVAFMDDLGHISPVVGITAIKYDNTKPVVDSYMWVDSANAEARNNTKLDVLDIDKQLKVAFTESLSGSGVRRIALKITKDANVVDGLAHSVKVYYSASDEVPSGTELALVPVEDVTDSSYKFYEIPSALTSGYLFFRGIPIAAVDGKYDVSVSLIDQALNESSASSPIAMFKDTTPPSVNQATVSVDNIVVRPGDNTQWLKRDAYNSNSVSFTVNETGSGIEFIVLTGSIGITDATTVTVNGVPAADVSLDVASNRIKFTNFKNPSIFGSSVSVKISGIKFTDRDSESGNTVSFRIEDFASTEPHDFEYGYKVYADSAAPVVASVKLHDADSTTEWTAGTTNYKYIYTNSDTVNATVVFADAEKGTNSCSGVRVLTVTGATITGATVSTGETCTVSGSTVTFTPPLRAGSETVELTGVTLVASDSENRSISAYATDFAEWTGDAVSSQKIVLDTLTPEVTEISWTVASGSDLIPGITGKKVVDDQKLNVTLGTTASGVKTVSVAVTIAGTQRSDSLKNENLTVYFDGTALTRPTDYSVSGNTLTFTTPRKSGVVSFEGLTIDDQDRDGSYAIDVSLKTAAENENNAASHYSISRDSVTPVISKVVIPPVTVGENQIPVIESVIPYGTDGTGTTPVYFAGAQAGFDYQTGKNSFTLDLYITEQTSGVQQITFGSGCNVRLSSESTLSVIHSGSTKDLVKGTDYTVDGTGKVITFLDSGDPVVKDESPEFVLSMTNCNFENVKYMDHESASDENRFSFTLKDFAQHSPETSVTAIKANKDGTEDIATVVANALPAAIGSVSLEDRSPCDANGNVIGSGDGPYDLRKSEEGFTNYEIINVAVGSPVVNVANRNYSVRKITLSGAKFISDVYNGSDAHTVVQVNGVPLNASSDYKFTDDDCSIEFNKSFDTKTTFQFFNVLLATTDDGEKTVSATAYSPAGVSYSAMSTKDKKIILDKTPPALADEGPFAYDPQDSENFRKYEYPRQKNDTDYETYGLSAKDLELATYGSMAGNTGYEIRFFYTSQDYRRLPVKVEDTNSLSSTCLQIKVVDSIEAGKATSQGVLNAAVYGHPSYNKADFSTGRLGYTPEDVGYYRYESKDWSDTLNPYTYVAADRAGNVSEPHQFYVIKDANGPSKTYDGSDFNTNTDKSLVNLMTLKCPTGKTVYRNSDCVQSDNVLSPDFFFWEADSGHSCENIYAKQYVLSDDDYTINIRLNGVKSEEKLIGGEDAPKGTYYSERMPTASQSGIAAYAISHYYYSWNGSSDDNVWDCAYPENTLNVAHKTNKIFWTPYDPTKNDGDISYTIPKTSSVGVPPLTLLLKDNCGNVSQILIRPKNMEAIDENYTIGDKTGYGMSGRSVSWIFDKKLPEPVAWSADNEKNLNDQFIIFAGGCDNRECKNISKGDTSFAVGCNRLGALYLDIPNKTQYYNHNVYLQLRVNSEEPIRWADQEVCTNNVQPLYENDLQPPEFTLRARVLFREGTDANEPPEESDFAGMSSASLTKWSYFKQKSTDGKRLWNILMPHGDEGKLGTLWLYLEDYVGNKGIYQVKNGGDVDIKNGSDVDKFVWNDEPPKVKLRTVADYPATYDTAKTETNASCFSENFGTYRHYTHLAFTDEADIKRLVPPTTFKKMYIKKQTSNMSDTRYSAMINKAEADGLVMNDIKVIGDVTYVGNTAHNVSGGVYAREKVGNNTYAVDPVLCFFDIDVSDSPSGIDGYRYCYDENKGDDNRQNDWEGNRSDEYWYINHTGKKNDSNRVNAQVPINLSYDKEGAEPEYNKRTFNLYIRDRVGNVSVTKLGNQWMMDNTYPATASGSTWTGGKANPGNSYLSLPGADYRTNINVTIAGSSETFKTAKEREESYSVKIPAEWFTDFQKRNGNASGTGESSGVYGAGLIPNVKGSAKPIVDGNLTVDIPYFIYKDADAKTAQKLEYYIFDNTGNYWTCNLNVKVDASAPTMRVGVTRLNDSSTFHTPNSLYKRVYGSEAVPSDVTTWNTAPDSLYQGSGLNSYKKESGYSNNWNDKLYSLASNVSKQYETKSDVDNAYQYGTPDEKSRFFKIQCNNHSFFVNAWADDDGGISQVAIRRWDGSNWNSTTALGKLEFTNDSQSVKTMKFEGIPSVDDNEIAKLLSGTNPCPDSGKETSSSSDSSIRNSIYVSTISQATESLYEVSATDFAGNAVFYYAYILPYDNKAPDVTAAPVTGNDGSSVVGGKFYFKELKFSLEASDDLAGLGAYQWGAGTPSTDYFRFNLDGTISKDGTVAYTDVTEIFKDNDSSAFWVKLQDILGNVKTVDSFTVNGGSTSISNADFVYDNVAPELKSTVSINRTGQYKDHFESKNDTTGSTTESFISNDYSNGKIYVLNNDFDSTIAIEPSASDDVRGFILTNSDSDTKPAVDSASVFEKSLVFTAGKAMTDNVTNRTVKLDEKDNGLTVNIWAVDYAGNISETSKKLTIAYFSTVPTIVNGSGGAEGEERRLSVTGSIYTKDDVNYFSSAAVNVGVEHNKNYAPKNYLFLTSENYASGVKTKSGTITPLATSTDTKSEYDISLPEDSDFAGKDIWLAVYWGSSYSSSYHLVYEGVGKWTVDKDVPSVPSAPKIQEGSKGLYTADSKVYFSSEVSGGVEFTVTDSGSGAAGVIATDSSTAPSSGTAIKLYKPESAGTVYFWGVDNVGNINKTGKLTIEFISDSTAPVIVGASPSPVEDKVSVDSAVSSKYYFNPGTVDSIIFDTGSVTESGSGLDHWEYKLYTETEPEPDSTVVLPEDKKISIGSEIQTLKVYAVDKVGNVSDPFTFSLIPDTEGPSGLKITGVKNGETSVSDGIYVLVNGNGTAPDSLDWSSIGSGEATIYFNSNTIASPLVASDIDGLTDASGVKEVKASYKVDGADSAEISKVNGKTTVVTLTPYDKVGNAGSPFTVNLIAAGALPSCSTTQINIRNGQNNEKAFYMASSNAVSGTWYGLKDNGVGNGYDTKLYSSGTTVSIPVSGGIADDYSYAFTYGSYDELSTLSIDSNSGSPSDGWSKYVKAADGRITIALPDVETKMHGYLMVWLKDRVANVSYPYNVVYPESNNMNWLGQYKAATGAGYKYENNKLTIYDYPASAGVKKITLACDVVDSANLSSLPAANSKFASYDITPTVTKNEDNTIVTLTFTDAMMTTGDIVIELNSSTSAVTSVTITDVADNNYVPTTRSISFLGKMSETVSSAFGNIFGRIAGDKETRALKAAERADKKAARQAEIAAAKEAKKMAKLLVKQQKEEARRLKESLAVQNADIGVLESKSVSAGTETAALADQDVEFEARSSGIDQWNKSAVAAIKRGKSGKKNGSFPVVPFAAGAMVLCACGAGVFIYRKKKSL
ncbi:MAG: Ig-like domain-containing protein [Spirochaetia bacterium]|nr:Ig-like domain-containing protein [Spirochaetia bacterium]